MDTRLKILLLEDDHNDAEMIQRVLVKASLHMELKLVMNRDDFLVALDSFQPELILSDNSLPQFSATEVLVILKEKTLHIPFILVTGTVSEEFAAGIIKLGADDYILKDRLTRLPAAIESALKQKRIEKEKLVSEENLNAIFENTSEGFVLIDREYIVRAYNRNGKKYAFYITDNELESGSNIFDFVRPEAKDLVAEMFTKVFAGEKAEHSQVYEVEGVRLWLSFTIMPVWKNEKIAGACITGRDITELKNAEKLKRTMERENAVKEIQEQKKITRAIIQGEEKERNYIGQELHDNVNQILAAIKIHMDKACRDNPAVAPSLEYPTALVNLCMKEIRMLSSQLVAPVNGIHLEDMLRKLLDGVTDNASVQTSFFYEASPGFEEDNDLKLNIYRIIQEQVNNILKHAHADKITVSVQDTDGHIKIMMEDNGQGFDTNQKRKGIGISNMINRVKSFNGELAIDSTPGKGCRIEIVIPL
ncbi:MAG: ATP-binding protein [Bacteroidota bacterium]